MPRPTKKRCIRIAPGEVIFKPAGIPLKKLKIITIRPDEMEALRLADLAGLYHDQAGRLMNISRQSFERILRSARKKIIQALLEGKALRIESVEECDDVEVTGRRKGHVCRACGWVWESGKIAKHCPECGCEDIRTV